MKYKTPFERKTAERLVVNKIEEIYRRMGYMNNHVDSYHQQGWSPLQEMCDDYLIYFSELLSAMDSDIVRAEIVVETVEKSIDTGTAHNADGVIACSCPLPKKDKKSE